MHAVAAQHELAHAHLCDADTWVKLCQAKLVTVEQKSAPYACSITHLGNLYPQCHRLLLRAMKIERPAPGKRGVTTQFPQLCLATYRMHLLDVSFAERGLLDCINNLFHLHQRKWGCVAKQCMELRMRLTENVLREAEWETSLPRTECATVVVTVVVAKFCTSPLDLRTAAMALLKLRETEIHTLAPEMP